MNVPLSSLEANAPKEKTFDLAGALERLDGNQELLEKLIEFFLEDYPQLYSRIEKAIAASEAQELERAAHSLQGLAATFNAAPAARAARRLESLGRDGDFTAAQQSLPELRQQLDRLVQGLTAHRTEESSS